MRVNFAAVLLLWREKKEENERHLANIEEKLILIYALVSVIQLSISFSFRRKNRNDSSRKINADILHSPLTRLINLKCHAKLSITPQSAEIS